jgi:hypothetical protein
MEKLWYHQILPTPSTYNKHRTLEYNGIKLWKSIIYMYIGNHYDGDKDLQPAVYHKEVGIKAIFIRKN